MVDLALFNPDQAGNVGAILRLAACFAVPCHIIEPCGFPFSERALKRAGMDYADFADMRRHADWDAFEAMRHASGQRLILMTSSGDGLIHDFAFRSDDILCMGSESAGAPAHVHRAADARLRIPIGAPARSLNLAIASGIALAEALRQTATFPAQEDDHGI